MKGLNKFPPEYFLKYKEKPVVLVPFSSIQEEVGEYYIQWLSEILRGVDLEILLRGSTLYKILGKGEVEVGVYPEEEDWDRVISLLKDVFGDPGNIEENYARFNQEYKSTEVEIILLKGHEATVDIKVHQYLLSHPELLREYEKVKSDSAYSKREYQIQKNNFLTKVIEQIPE